MSGVDTFRCKGCCGDVPVTMEHDCQLYDGRPVSFRPAMNAANAVDTTERAIELADKFGGFVVTTGEAGVEIFRESTCPAADLVPGDQLASAPSLSLAIERALETVVEGESK